jgi:hypothetical protein
VRVSIRFNLRQPARHGAPFGIVLLQAPSNPLTLYWVLAAEAFNLLQPAIPGAPLAIRRGAVPRSSSSRWWVIWVTFWDIDRTTGDC